MNKPVFRDTRLTRAADLLSSGGIKLLSLDVFDTLLGRRVPNPPDVFLYLGKKLQDKSLLCNGQAPESFAAIRYQTEYARRAIRQKEFGDREVNLTEIYSYFPKHIVNHSLTVRDLVELEIQTEFDLCFSNQEIISLAHHAKSLGIKITLISNTYLSLNDLERLIHTAAPNLPKVDAIFSSAERRIGKRTGLMMTMCNEFSISPQAILHIGDNPISDRLAAEEIGMPFIDFCTDINGIDTLLTDEQPRQWVDRTASYAGDNGDFGTNWLRRQACFWTLPQTMPTEQEFFYKYGACHMGPLLTGFTAWATERAAQEQAGCIFGLLREGDFLTHLLKKHNPKQPTQNLAANRLTVALSTFTPDTPHHLEDFLTRRGFWTIGMLMEQLGFTREQAKQIDDPDLTLETITPSELTRRIVSSPLAGQLYKTSADKRKRLLKHMSNIGALGHDKLFLLDLGYAATIQRGIQRLFEIENLPIITHGLYLASAHVSLATQLAGGIVEGFLAQNGNPNDFACAFCRSPEIVEVCCMPDYGTVVGFDENGNPFFEDQHLPLNQIIEVASVQKGCTDYADMFLNLQRMIPFRKTYTAQAWQKQMRLLALRLVAHPTEDEAKKLGHWLADSDMGLTSPRPIVSVTGYERPFPALTPDSLAALPRRDVPWLFGVAATLSYAHCRQVAQIIMRHEKPDAFSELEPRAKPRT